jgi:Siphovirus Gp157
MEPLTQSKASYLALRERLKAEDPSLDEQTLADTVEGLTNLHDIIEAIVRAALIDEALAGGLKTRVRVMQERFERFEERAAKRRQMARDAMSDADIKKITAPDFTITVRPGTPALVVVDETTIPGSYWEAVAPRLNRQALVSQLKQGASISGVELSNPKPVLSVRIR